MEWGRHGEKLSGGETGETNVFCLYIVSMDYFPCYGKHELLL